MNIPALNQIAVNALADEPKQPDSDNMWLILFPEDHNGYGSDPEGNVALLLNEEQARELRRLADNAVEELADGDSE